MDSLLVTLLCFGIFFGYNAQPAGQSSYMCGDGEEFNMCGNPCQPTCDSVVNETQTNCSKACVPGCFCMEGLVKAKDGTCVPREMCTSTRSRPLCKENEEFNVCGSPCESNCTNMNLPIFCTKPCHSGCFCKPNFVRDSKGQCIPADKCLKVTSRRRCPANEHHVDCVDFCNTCWESGHCRTPFCRPGCDCLPGYYRNYYGECVTEEQCYSTIYGLRNACGENEEYSECVNQCNTCAMKGLCYANYYCQPGCDCKAGYLRNERGVCVPERNCYTIKQRVCPRNEQFYDCIPRCRNTCDNVNTPDVICDLSCTAGCSCRKGMVRRSDGECVLPHTCPRKQPTCPPGEVFYQCLPTCRTTCQALNATKEVCTSECRAGCFCQPGFVKNDKGECVRPDECVPRTPSPPTCPTGEVYHKCKPPCRNTCETKDSKRPCVPGICVPGCGCPTGFVRRKDGRCIRSRNCPIVCGANEEFRSCASPCPLTCANHTKSQVCTLMCVRACVCKAGFVRGPTGRCIRPKDCPLVSTPESSNIGGRRGGSDGDDDDAEITSTTVTTLQTQTANSENATDGNITATTAASDAARGNATDSAAVTTEFFTRAETTASAISNDKSITTLSAENSTAAVSGAKSNCTLSAETSTAPVSDDKSNSTLGAETSTAAVSDDKNNSTLAAETSTAAVSDDKSNSTLSAEISSAVVSSQSPNENVKEVTTGALTTVEQTSIGKESDGKGSMPTTKINDSGNLTSTTDVTTT